MLCLIRLFAAIVPDRSLGCAQAAAFNRRKEPFGGVL